MKTIKAPAPGGVVLFRDDHGLPHIRATELEHVYWGMGYCHALDRPVQLYLMRILGHGRAAELLDGSDETVDIDRFFRRMNWGGRMDDQLAALTDQSRRLLDAYADGVNARLAEKRVWELRLLGYQPEPWTPADCLMLSRMTGYLTLAQSQAEVERLYMEMLQAGISDDKLSALFPDQPRPVHRDTLAQVRLGERIVPPQLKWLPGTPRTMASNNWCVAASHSKTGGALLANDPHLEINRLPNVWVEQVVELPDDTFIIANMPGLPAALIGRNKSLSWGATYTFMDAVDSWVEKCKDGCFRRGDDWIPFDERAERILRKKGEPVDIAFHENLHGTLEGDPHEPGFLLTTRWAPADSGAATINASVDMWRATNVAEGMDALGRVETAWNWVLADAAGDIGYQMSGRMPVRHIDANGLTPMPGWDPDYDWQGWVPHTDLPRQVNPPEGFIVTANQDLNHLGQVDPINMPMGDYRARRIAQRLAAAKCDLDTFGSIQMDVWSNQAEDMLALLLPLLPPSRNATLLREWNRCYDPDSRGAPVFEAFYRALRHELFAPGGFGEPVLDHLTDVTGVFIDFYQNFDRLLVAETSPWHEGRSRDDVFRAAFARIDDTDHGRWGDRNRVVLRHVLFGGKLPKWLGFDRGPIELRGGRATPHQGQVYKSAGRDTSFAPSMRLLADMSDSVLRTAMIGGPRDRRWSKWYASGVQGWLDGTFKVVKRGDDT